MLARSYSVCMWKVFFFSFMSSPLLIFVFISMLLNSLSDSYYLYVAVMFVLLIVYFSENTLGGVEGSSAHELLYTENRGDLVLPPFFAIV